ncbi:MAG: 16S rRNA (adenine(1518)-N(6)/adenine(1519)-N(6))-dimethyltransferase [Alphaproteobacteria bacterium]|nr:16S rRNA (adenine(1518)-N(6)/adenine(1519)-N(6))-dimethyltransferase [Alphaproteobacteria bacterium]
MIDYQAWYHQQWQTFADDKTHYANKNLGQHFIYDFAILQKIAQSAKIESANTVLEIGPGLGGLTAAILAQMALTQGALTKGRLAKGVGRVYAIEKDKILAEKLVSLQKLSAGRLQIITQDARDFDINIGTQPRIIIANLPYNVGTFLLNRFLQHAELLSEMVLMFQREVGCRLVARPFSGEYGRLSVLAQARADIKTVMVLPPGAFRPAPKIASSVIKFTMRDLPDLDYKMLQHVTSILFAQRRKKIQTVLRAHGIAIDAWHDAPVDGNLRPESIAVQDFIALCGWVKGKLSQD